MRVASAVQEEREFNLEYRIVDKEDKERWVWDKGHGIWSKSGELLGVEGFAVDVTRRRVLSDALGKSQRRFETLAQMAPVGIFHTDPDGWCFYVNEQWCKITGLSSEDAEGERWMDSLHPHDCAEVVDRWDRAVRDHEPFEAEYRFRTRSGKVTWVLGQAVPEIGEDGEVHGYVGTVTDISHVKKLESRVVQAEKMKSMGRMAGGIAHDFNNLLAVISGNADLAIRELPADHPVQEDAQAITEAVNRGKDLVSDLMAFARQRMSKRELTDLNEIVSNVQSMLPHLMTKNVDIEVYLDQRLGPVRINPTQMEVALMNLASNARDAMPEEGRFTLETSAVTIDTSRAAFLGKLDPGEYALLRVSDTGTGMDEETLQNIFDPFFTTKDLGEGTGLGLSTVFGIVKEAGGHIDVESSPGEGTEFLIYLPVAPE